MYSHWVVQYEPHLVMQHLKPISGTESHFLLQYSTTRYREAAFYHKWLPANDLLLNMNQSCHFTFNCRSRENPCSLQIGAEWKSNCFKRTARQKPAHSTFPVTLHETVQLWIRANTTLCPSPQWKKWSQSPWSNFPVSKQGKVSRCKECLLFHQQISTACYKNVPWLAISALRSRHNGCWGQQNQSSGPEHSSGELDGVESRLPFKMVNTRHEGEGLYRVPDLAHSWSLDSLV